MPTGRRWIGLLFAALLLIIVALLITTLYFRVGLRQREAELAELATRLSALEKGSRQMSWEEVQQSPELRARIQQLANDMSAATVAELWKQFDPEKAVGLWLNAKGWVQRRQLATPQLRDTLPKDDAWIGGLFAYRQAGKPEWTGDVDIVDLTDHAWRTGDRTTVRVRLPFAPRTDRKAVTYVQEITFDMVYTLVNGWQILEVKRSQPDPAGIGP